jgi:hypothetical protein
MITLRLSGDTVLREAPRYSQKAATLPEWAGMARVPDASTTSKISMHEHTPKPVRQPQCPALVIMNDDPCHRPSSISSAARSVNRINALPALSWRTVGTRESQFALKEADHREGNSFLVLTWLLGV